MRWEGQLGTQFKLFLSRGESSNRISQSSKGKPCICSPRRAQAQEGEPISMLDVGRGRPVKWQGDEQNDAERGCLPTWVAPELLCD